MRPDVVATVTTASIAALAAFALGCTTSASAGASIAPPSGCFTNGALVCPGGGDGWTCAAGDNPENLESGLSCSVPQPDGPNDDFCCFAWTFGTSTCTPSDTITSVCQYPSYGYTCAAGDNPTSLDPSLNCSSPTPDGPNDDFCCT
ncbi:MAG TPA: hypothetical protein VE987_19265 [Polyangiaceae bacterium]|nr:hypothetical protein [Polyangiaceae bacterium]